jgi:hypothetical protein
MVDLQTRIVGQVGPAAAKTVSVLSQISLRTFLLVITTLLAAVPAYGIQKGTIGECLAREGRTSIIDAKSRSRYEAKLCVTPDDVARYVFLTNRWDYGDRSAAVYRARSKKGSLPGDYWITATVAEDSTRGHRRNIRVRRHDAPLPDSLAKVLHELWVTTIEQSPVDEDAIPCAPTAVFSATTEKGVRLRAVTVYLDQNSFCHPLLTLGGSLLDYAELPRSKRPQAAAKIERECLRLLNRVTQKR